MSRIQGRLLAGAVALALAAGLTAVPPAGAAAPAAPLLDLQEPGSYRWTVPAGVTAVSIDAFGAAGGNVDYSAGMVAAGGLGGVASGVLGVQPGQVLQVTVGGAGPTDTGSGQPGEPGGFNGGGASTGYGAPGGGASDVRVGGCATGQACGLSDRVLVGGGGGGAVYDDVYSARGYAGGAGGGLTGGDGSHFSFPEEFYLNLPDATGGTQMAGGQGSGDADSGYPFGGDGSFGEGGPAGSPARGGGGGGGGWYGGGGGGPLYSGAGGSSHTALGLDGTTSPGVRAGGGRVVISKAAPKPTQQSLSFTATGQTQRFVVPAGVRSLAVDLAGGSGGSGTDEGGTQMRVTPGGKGARVTTKLAVTPGQVLYVNAGGVGPPTDLAVPVTATSCPTAFGGGGAGGMQYGGPNELPVCGPGGGGASDIRTSPALVDRIVVAGGGGGSAQHLAGRSYRFDDSLCPWSGGDSGSQGASSVNCSEYAGVVGGMPGTASGGGAANNPYVLQPNGEYFVAQGGVLFGGPYRFATDGVLGQGGSAGFHDVRIGDNRNNYIGFGGAGGGGLYGGGGGTGMAFTGTFTGYYSGGGGGSSLLPQKAKASALTEGANTGPGFVTVTW